MSKILCVIDGMTDPGFRAENYPNLRAARLKCFFDTCQGEKPESFGCILRLLGIENPPRNARSYAEALGYGIKVYPGDLVLRGSWFALDQDGRCICPTTAPEVVPNIPCVRYWRVGQYKSILVISNAADTLSRIQTKEPYLCGQEPADSFCPEGNEVLRSAFFALKSADKCMIPWGASSVAEVNAFPQKAAVVCGAAVVKGIARMFGLTLVESEGANGETDTNLRWKVGAALEAAEEYPFVVLHVNGADEAAHRMSVIEKNEFLMKVDNVVLKKLLESGHEIYVAADHGTDPETGKHLNGEQPIYTNVG